MNRFINRPIWGGLGLIIMSLILTTVSDAKLTGPELLEAAVAIWTFEKTERNEDNDPFFQGHFWKWS